MGGAGSGRLRIGQPKLTREANRIRNKNRSTKWRAENKELNYQKLKKWREQNPVKSKEVRRNNYLNSKVKKLTKYLSDRKYERDHPGRALKYYQDNKEDILNNRKEYRIKKRQNKVMQLGVRFTFVVDIGLEEVFEMTF